MYYFVYYNLFLIWLSFYITPQIIHNVMRGGNMKLDNLYIFGIMLPSFLVPVKIKKL